MTQFDVNNYVPVSARILEFWEKYPEGKITTEIIEHTGIYLECYKYFF